MITIDAVLPRLENVRRTPRGWGARCPVKSHADRSPSMSVAEGRGGRALLYCFAGCSYSEIVQALGLETGGISARPDAPRSTFEIALELARRQPGGSEEVRSIYRISDAIRRRRRAVLVARSIAARAGDRPEVWDLLATAARVENEADKAEAELDEIIRIRSRYHPRKAA